MLWTMSRFVEVWRTTASTSSLFITNHKSLLTKVASTVSWQRALLPLFVLPHVPCTTSLLPSGWRGAGPPGGLGSGNDGPWGECGSCPAMLPPASLLFASTRAAGLAAAGTPRNVARSAAEVVWWRPRCAGGPRVPTTTSACGFGGCRWGGGERWVNENNNGWDKAHQCVQQRELSRMHLAAYILHLPKLGPEECSCSRKGNAIHCVH